MSDVSFVLDTSVTVASVLPYERWHREADVLMQSLLVAPALVPGVWVYEVSNTLLRVMRDGKITAHEAEFALHELFQIPVAVVSGGYRGTVLTEVWQVARYSPLKFNDASFLHLAMVLGAPLATFDVQLRGVAAAHGVEVLPKVL